VYVWALEQTAEDGTRSHYWRREKREEEEELTVDGLAVHANGTPFVAQDVLVPFKSAGERHLRFYHVFRAGELEALLAEVEGVTIEEAFFESGNWAAIVRKTHE